MYKGPKKFATPDETNPPLSTSLIILARTIVRLLKKKNTSSCSLSPVFVSGILLDITEERALILLYKESTYSQRTRRYFTNRRTIPH